MEKLTQKSEEKYELTHSRQNIEDDFYCEVCQKKIIIQHGQQAYLGYDNQTGEVLGWICNICRTGISKFGNDVNVIQRAIRWIKQSSSEGKT